MLDRTSERGRLLYLYPKSKQCGYEFSVPALETYVMQRTSPILRLCLYSFNIFFQHQAIGHELFCRSHNRFCIATRCRHNAQQSSAGSAVDLRTLSVSGSGT